MMRRELRHKMYEIGSQLGTVELEIRRAERRMRWAEDKGLTRKVKCLDKKLLKLYAKKNELEVQLCMVELDLETLRSRPMQSREEKLEVMTNFFTDVCQSVN